jgi:hypothetical protein
MTPAQEAAERERASELGSLRRAWGDCYKIWYDAADAVWIAERRDDRARVRRHQPWELLSEIRDDHAARPVPQQFRTREAG